MRRLGFLVVVVVVAVLSASAAQARQWTYRAEFKGNPHSSVLFDATGNKKGTKMSIVEHITLWQWPTTNCGTDTYAFFFGPTGVSGNSFSFGGGGIAIHGKFKQKGKKVSGTLSSASGCTTDGNDAWSGRRLK